MAPWGPPASRREISLPVGWWGARSSGWSSVHAGSAAFGKQAKLMTMGGYHLHAFSLSVVWLQPLRRSAVVRRSGSSSQLVVPLVSVCFRLGVLAIAVRPLPACGSSRLHCCGKGRLLPVCQLWACFGRGWSASAGILLPGVQQVCDVNGGCRLVLLWPATSSVPTVLVQQLLGQFFPSDSHAGIYAPPALSYGLVLGLLGCGRPGGPYGNVWQAGCWEDPPCGSVSCMALSRVAP